MPAEATAGDGHEGGQGARPGGGGFHGAVDSSAALAVGDLATGSASGHRAKELIDRAERLADIR